MTPAYAIKRGLNIISLNHLAEESGGALPPINCLRGGFVKPKGFVIVNVQIPCVKGYNEDQIVIVMDDLNMKECPVLLGTPTIYRVMPLIKKSEINQLAIPWATSRLSWMLYSVTAAVATLLTDVANKTLSPTELNEILRTSGKVQVSPFRHKIILGKTGLILQGYKMDVMTHGLEKRSPQLPLGIEVLYSYATLTTWSDRIAVSLRNTTDDWVLINKGVTIVRMEAANLVPPVTTDFITSKPQTQKLSEEERQKALMEKLDLSGLASWDEDLATKAKNLLMEYHDLFSLEKSEIGQTKTVKHTIVLKDSDTAPFKDRFCRIQPPQVEEVREHLKLMLEVGANPPSNSPWCNAVVLVRKKDGSLWFCINFRKLNSLTRKDSQPLPCIGETLDSLVGSAIYSTFNLTSGFWHVPMAEESKQYTAFTLGSMGLFECGRMPFCLCNAPATF